MAWFRTQGIHGNIQQKPQSSFGCHLSALVLHLGSMSSTVVGILSFRHITPQDESKSWDGHAFFFGGGCLFGWKNMSLWDTVGGTSTPWPDILCWWILIIHPDQFFSRLEKWCCLFSNNHAVKIHWLIVDRECRWFPNGSPKSRTGYQQEQVCLKITDQQIQNFLLYLLVHT